MTAEFLATALIVVLIPGTGVVYTISMAIGGGLRRGLFAALGCTLGIIPHIAAAMLGLSGVMQAGATAFEVVRWLGVAYLVVIGIVMIRAQGTLEVENEAGTANDATFTVMRRGVLLNLLNPKLTIFFFAFLPQFLDHPPSMLDSSLMALGGVFMAITLVVFAGYAYAGSAVREKVLAAPQVLRWVQRSLGALLIGFAVRLAFTDR